MARLTAQLQTADPDDRAAVFAQLVQARDGLRGKLDALKAREQRNEDDPNPERDAGFASFRNVRNQSCPG